MCTQPARCRGSARRAGLVPLAEPEAAERPRHHLYSLQGTRHGSLSRSLPSSPDLVQDKLRSRFFHSWRAWTAARAFERRLLTLAWVRRRRIFGRFAVSRCRVLSMLAAKVAMLVQLCPQAVAYCRQTLGLLCATAAARAGPLAPGDATSLYPSAPRTCPKPEASPHDALGADTLASPRLPSPPLP